MQGDFGAVGGDSAYAASTSVRDKPRPEELQDRLRMGNNTNGNEYTANGERIKNSCQNFYSTSCDEVLTGWAKELPPSALQRRVEDLLS